MRAKPMPVVHVCDGTNHSTCSCRKRRPEQIRRDNLSRRYGITVEEWEALRAAQDYRCAICRRHEDELPRRNLGGRPRKDGTPTAAALPLVIDHCHTGGTVRALLCPDCNIGLGMFGDDPHRLEAAAAHLRKSRLPH